MILITVSSYAWKFQRTAVTAIVERLLNDNEKSGAVVLDRSTVNRESENLHDYDCNLPIHEIEFSCWLKDGTVEDGIIDVPRIRQSASQIPIEQLTVINAAGHRDELIEEALAQARYAWFPLDQWHPAFVLVCDDIYLLKLSDALAFSFYCQPEVLTDREARRVTRVVQRRAFTYRWLGPGAGKFEAKVFKILSAIVKWWDTTMDRHEIRKQ